MARAEGDALKYASFCLIQDGITLFYLKPEAGVDLNQLVGHRIGVNGVIENAGGRNSYLMIKVAAATLKE